MGNMHRDDSYTISFSDFQFFLCVCIKSGDGFLLGEVYPIVGDNNGWQMCYCSSQNDAHVIWLHNYGDVLKDSNGVVSAEFNFFLPNEKHHSINGYLTNYPISPPEFSSGDVLRQTILHQTIDDQESQSDSDKSITENKQSICRRKKGLRL